VVNCLNVGVAAGLVRLRTHTNVHCSQVTARCVRAGGNIQERMS
jgi:hypothetical protein